MLTIQRVNISDLAVGLLVIEDELSRVKLKKLRKLRDIDRDILELQELNKREGELELVMKSLRRSLG